MSYYIIQTILGPIGYEIIEGKIVAIDFNPTKTVFGNETNLSRKIESDIKKYLIGEIKTLDFPIQLKVISFQKNVLEAMKKIPYGETMSYQQLAKDVGIPKGSRAVGNACGANPIPLYYPCHRVIKSDGELGGFSGGISIKKQLLMIESKNK